MHPFEKSKFIAIDNKSNKGFLSIRRLGISKTYTKLGLIATEQQTIFCSGKYGFNPVVS